MIKVIQYVRDALPAIGKYVMMGGYSGRLAIKNNLDPDQYAVTGDFCVCTGHKHFQPVFPLNGGGGACPMLFSGLDLTDQDPDPDDLCTIEELLDQLAEYTFGGESDSDEAESDVKAEKPPVKKEKPKEDSEGDKLMDFFFSKKKKVPVKEEEREEWGKEGFEFF